MRPAPFVRPATEEFAETAVTHVLTAPLAAFTLHFSPFDFHFPPTNTLDFRGLPDFPRGLAAAPASPRCELKNLPLEIHNPKPKRFIPIQVVKRSKGE